MTYMNPSDKTKNQKSNDDPLHLYDDPTMNDDYLFSASCNDMTGLAPTVAHNETEAQNYEEIYPYLPPVPPNPAVGVPDTAMSDGIQTEMRKCVSPQTHKPESR